MSRSMAGALQEHVYANGEPGVGEIMAVISQYIAHDAQVGTVSERERNPENAWTSVRMPGFGCGVCAAATSPDSGVAL